jgi:hypothetical protein
MDTFLLINAPVDGGSRPSSEPEPSLYGASLPAPRVASGVAVASRSPSREDDDVVTAVDEPDAVDEAEDEVDAFDDDEDAVEDDLEAEELDEDLDADDDADEDLDPEALEPGDDDEDDAEGPSVTVLDASAAFDDDEDEVVAAVVDDDDDDEIEGVRDGEFVCRRCFMAKRDTQLADADQLLCRDCA